MEKIKLNKGYVLVYDFGSIKLHNYNTSDSMEDQVIILEKNHQLAIIESPAFYDNNVELENYISHLNAQIDGVLLSYHMSGGTFLKNSKKYATKKSDYYGHVGGGKTLIDNFAKTFGESFDQNIHAVTDYMEEGNIKIADINFNIIPTNDAFDIEIPEINVIYTHMLGSECHSIIAGVDQANAMIETLKGYIEKDYQLILTSHYIPEGIEAVKTKIDYIKTILSYSKICSDSNEMIQKVNETYPNYSGQNYLEMTANFFF